MTAQWVRTRMLVTVACALMVCVRGLPAAAHGPQGDERTVLLTALDKDGEPIRDLKAGDFTVSEDGATREVVSASVTTVPLFIDLLADTSKPVLGSAEPIHDLRTGLTTFVKTVQAASPDAQIAFGEFAGVSMQTVNFTAKTADLTKVIGRLATSQRSSAVLLEALVDASKDIGKKLGRRVIVSVSFDAPESSTVDPGAVMNAVNKSGSAFWPISCGMGGGAPARDLVLQALPGLTGGLLATAVTATSLDPKLKALADALTTQYAVTYRGGAGAVSLTSIQASAKGADKVVVGLMPK